jgi:hypothetical protein
VIVGFGGLTSGAVWFSMRLFRLRIDHIYEVIGVEMETNSKQASERNAENKKLDKDRKAVT